MFFNADRAIFQLSNGDTLNVDEMTMMPACARLVVLLQCKLTETVLLTHCWSRSVDICFSIALQYILKPKENSLLQNEETPILRQRMALVV
jgi:hypothetical protein